jgi:hypothetical protein
MNKFDAFYKKIINENIEPSPKLAIGDTITWYGDEEYGIKPYDIKVLKISPNGKFITAGDKRGSLQFNIDKDKHKFTKKGEPRVFRKVNEPGKGGRSRATVVDKIKNDQWLENDQVVDGVFFSSNKSWTKKFRDADEAIKWIEDNKEEKDWENWEIEFKDEDGEGVLVYYPQSKAWRVDFT